MRFVSRPKGQQKAFFVDFLSGSTFGGGSGARPGRVMLNTADSAFRQSRRGRAACEHGPGASGKPGACPMTGAPSHRRRRRGTAGGLHRRRAQVTAADPARGGRRPRLLRSSSRLSRYRSPIAEGTGAAAPQGRAGRASAGGPKGGRSLPPQREGRAKRGPYLIYGHYIVTLLVDA